MVDEEEANVVVYGREENGERVYDSTGFHAWVECNGWLIDFMAPIMGKSLREDGQRLTYRARCSRSYSRTAGRIRVPFNTKVSSSASAISRSRNRFWTTRECNS